MWRLQYSLLWLLGVFFLYSEMSQKSWPLLHILIICRFRDRRAHWLRVILRALLSTKLALFRACRTNTVHHSTQRFALQLLHRDAALPCVALAVSVCQLQCQRF